MVYDGQNTLMFSKSRLCGGYTVGVEKELSMLDELKLMELCLLSPVKSQ